VRRKYFTEEERRAAARASARRSYYKTHPLKQKRLGRRTKKAAYAFKHYWQKRAMELGYNKEDWRKVCKKVRALSRQKHWYFSDEARKIASKHDKKRYYAEHKNDPNFIAARRAASTRWRKAHPERNAAYIKAWHDSHKDYLKDYYSTLYSNKKRAERQRMLMAL
jgi:hypothetical protein